MSSVNYKCHKFSECMLSRVLLSYRDIMSHVLNLIARVWVIDICHSPLIVGACHQACAETAEFLHRAVCRPLPSDGSNYRECVGLCGVHDETALV